MGFVNCSVCGISLQMNIAEDNGRKWLLASVPSFCICFLSKKDKLVDIEHTRRERRTDDSTKKNFLGNQDEEDTIRCCSTTFVFFNLDSIFND
jgi:hypothetical protein